MNCFQDENRNLYVIRYDELKKISLFLKQNVKPSVQCICENVQNIKILMPNHKFIHLSCY